MKEERLTVAVVIPVYNRCALLLARLEALCLQEDAPDIVVVVDDGSSDGVADAARTWLSVRRPPFELKVVVQANAGVSVSRNRGVAEVPGTATVAFLDSDDFWPADYVARIRRAFADNPSWVAACANRLLERCDASGCPLGEVMQDTGKYARPEAVAWGPEIGGSNLVVRRAAFEECGGFPHGLQYGEDQVLSVHMSVAGAFGHLPGLPVRYMVQEGAATLTSRARAGSRIRMMRLIERAVPQPLSQRPDVRASLASGWVWAAKGCRAQRRMAGALACLTRARRHGAKWTVLRLVIKYWALSQWACR